MDKLKDSQNRQSTFTPINYVYKPIEKTGVSKAIFTTLKSEQNQQLNDQSVRSSHTLHESSKLKSSTNRDHVLTPNNLKQSHYIQQNQQKAHLQQKILFLQHCMNQYKLQALSSYSKLAERQKLFKEAKENYEAEIINFKNQVSNLQKQIQGQSKLIEQCHEKYDLQVHQHELCLKVINEQKLLIDDLNAEITTLQRAVNSTRQVSVNLIKQNQNIKAEINIEQQKYQMLFEDYERLSLTYQKGLRQLSDENRLLVRKAEEMDVQIKIYEKDQEIQKLLVYQGSIEKRQKQMYNLDKSSSSPPSLMLTSNYKNSPYEYLPRRLNFQDQTVKPHKRQYYQNQQNTQALNGIIQLQKTKISHLENQVKQLQKRNKQLQTLMVKFMK